MEESDTTIKYKITTYFLLISALFDITNALFLSHESEVKLENEFLSVLCTDRATGLPATWMGPKNRKLGERTVPMSRSTNYGTQLIFEKLKKEHEGTYICKTQSERAEFSLFVEPSIDFVDTPSVQEGLEGANIALRCDATGAKITWMIEGEEPKEPKYKMLADGLLVQNATKEDARIYVCNAFSEQTGTIKQKEIKLKVKYAPRLPEHNQTAKRHYVKEEIVYGFMGGDVNLTCEVEAEPPPEFDWYEKTNRKKIGEKVKGDSPYVSVLMLKMSPRTLGDYKCIATNEYGTVEVLFKVLNGTQPNPLASMEIKKVTSDSLTLEIYEPEPTEEESRTGMAPTGVRVKYRALNDSERNWIGKSLLLAEEKTYTIMDLQPDTEYQVRAATENRAGFSEFSNVTYFKTLPSSAVNLSMSFYIISITMFILLSLQDSLTNCNI